MPSFTLTDVARGLWIDSFTLGPEALGLSESSSVRITKKTLRGGRRDGVDLIEVDNGALAFSIIPTRGMGLWRGNHRGVPLGWVSPIADGPVNPSFVNLMNGGGIGWLEGFDELLVRCGLENNGAPYVEGQAVHTLHGKIANIPAHFAAVHVGEGASGEVTIEGRVDESRIFSTQIRMTTRITTAPGSNRLVVRDEFTNLKDQDADMQILYHWNLGPPFLADGSRFEAPVKAVCPRDSRAAEGIGGYAVYGPPTPGFSEQVYLFELHGRGEDLRTLVLLRDRAGEKGVALRFAAKQLPCFTLWKNTGGVNDGYVTGLEPATNYPSPKPFEKARGRVVPLEPGESYVAETALEVLEGREAVAGAEAEIAALQEQGKPRVHPRPVEPFAPEA